MEVMRTSAARILRVLEATKVPVAEFGGRWVTRMGQVNKQPNPWKGCLLGAGSRGELRGRNCFHRSGHVVPRGEGHKDNSAKKQTSRCRGKHSIHRHAWNVSEQVGKSTLHLVNCDQEW